MVKMYQSIYLKLYMISFKKITACFGSFEPEQAVAYFILNANHLAP